MDKKNMISWKKIKRVISSNRILIGIIIFTFLIRIYFFKTIGAESSEDPYIFTHLAKGILYGNFEIIGRFYHYQPFYPFLMALLNFVVGDLLLTGKIISLLTGVATIPVTYLLWKKLETKEVALFTVAFVAVNQAEWYFSIHVFRDILISFLTVLAFVVLFEAREDYRWLPSLAFILGLATLAHGIGYILTISIFLSFCYWELSFLKMKSNRKRNNYIVLSILIYILLILPWHLFRLVETKKLFPSFASDFVLRYGHNGLNWIPLFINSVTLPLFILSLVGIILSYKNRGKYLPFYLFILLFSIFNTWYGQFTIRYTIPLIPIILGWSSITLSKLPIKKVKVKHAIFTVLFLLLFVQSFTIISGIEHRGDSYEAVKESMVWFNSYSDKDTKIWVGDGLYYEYYTDRNLIWYDDVAVLINNDIKKHGMLNPENVYISSFIRGDIHYYVAFNSLPPWFYNEGHKFTSYSFIFEDKEVVFSPLKEFKKNDNIVYIFKVDW